MRTRTLLMTALAVVALIGAPVTYAQNLVANGSFETGDLSGWGGDQTGISVVSGPFYVYSGAQDGQFYAVFGAVGSDGSISQTISDMAGGQYTFSFWFNAVGDNPSDFIVSWDGTQLLSLTNPTTGGVWTQYSYQVTGTGSDTITFAGRDDPAWMALDNVSLTQNSTGTIPEPSSFILMGSGILALGGIARRRLGR